MDPGVVLTPSSVVRSIQQIAAAAAVDAGAFDFTAFCGILYLIVSCCLDAGSKLEHEDSDCFACGRCSRRFFVNGKMRPLPV